MNLVVKVLGLDIALCLRQLVTPRLLCGVVNIGCDDKPLRVVMESDAICGGLRDGG